MNPNNPQDSPQANPNEQNYDPQQVYPAVNALPPAQSVINPYLQSPPPQQNFNPSPQAQNGYPSHPAGEQVALKQPVNAGTIILQWLTYAFWGWTVLALSILTAMVISNFIADADIGGFTPYAIAAILVLLPISYICDHLYSKKEPQRKTGVEVLVMVIHAVIFALFGIGALIFAVFALVQLFTNSNGAGSAQANLYTALIIAVFYGLTFLRTLNPGSTPWIRKAFRIFMPVAIGIIALLGILGPVAAERTTRNDRLIATELPTIQTAINNHTRSTGKLPENLNALDLRADAKKLIDQKLVTYKPRTDVPAAPLVTDANSFEPVITYRYELCVNYKKESKDYGKYPSYSGDVEKDGFSSYLSVYDHPAGDICYKLKTSEY